jgi:hypothetical protein
MTPAETFDILFPLLCLGLGGLMGYMMGKRY